MTIFLIALVIAATIFVFIRQQKEPVAAPNSSGFYYEGPMRSKGSGDYIVTEDGKKVYSPASKSETKTEKRGKFLD